MGPDYLLQVDPSNKRENEKNNLSNSIHQNTGTTIEIITTTIAPKRRKKNLWE